MFPFVFLAIMLGTASWGSIKLARLLHSGPRAQKGGIAGYISSNVDLQREYLQYYGHALDKPEVVEPFERSARLIAKHDYVNAVAALESVLKDAELPLIYTDLAILYAKLDDAPAELTAFRNVFARDSAYAPARQFLAQRNQIVPGTADPLRGEVEPNDARDLANQIAMESAVTGEVGASKADVVDYYRLAAPPSPRDVITVELINNSSNFIPRLQITDASRHTVEWGERIGRRGESVKVSGAPPPNSTLYIAVAGADSTGGEYLLRVTAEKSYDRYEPNESIVDASRIILGQEISANIMDPADNDYYSFVSPRKGSVTLDLRSGSTTLTPNFIVYDREGHFQANAPTAGAAGGRFHETFPVEKDRVYYVQVSSQAGTSGAYSLRLD